MKRRNTIKLLTLGTGAVFVTPLVSGLLSSCKSEPDYPSFEPKFFDLIDGDDTYLEKEPMERAVSKGELFAYKHKGFWQCMDTKRDKDILEEIYAKGAPWIKK